MRNLRTVYFNLLNPELCEECSRTLGMGWNSWGSSSRSGRNRGAVEADAITEHAATEADAIGEQQLKRTQSRSSSSAQRAVRRRMKGN